ncbi:MAG: hypothetical protein GY710_04435 [Desulfobacteraceae bacterium]|nr:hypothetical protein [Desulfobacteraceae bacterium]
MNTLPQPYILISMTGAIFWILTYLMIIKRGFQDKSFGIPLWALSMNISWEFIYSFVVPSPMPQRYINVVWFVIDLVILWQVLKYWREDYRHMKAKYFYPYLGIILGTAFLGVLFIQFDALTVLKPKPFLMGMGRAYSAFGMNLIMSILFVNFILVRNHVRGQSLYIASFKCIGTALTSLIFFMYPELPGTPGADEYLFSYLYISIFIFDVIYIVLVFNKCKAQGLNPWKRM